MSTKTLMYLGGFVGSIIGGYLPALWGAGLLSFTSVLTSGIGGIIGVVVVYKLVS